MFPLLPQKYAKANQTYFMKVEWSSQLNKQPKWFKKNLKKFRFDRESNRPGARFSKVPIINGPGKLSPFALKIEVSIVLHLKW